MAALTEKFIEQTPSHHLGHVRVDEVGRHGLGRLAALDAVRDLCANQPVSRVQLNRAVREHNATPSRRPSRRVDGVEVMIQ